MSETFSTFILWGQSPEPDDTPTRYDFESQKELDAFLEGVEEACGWMGYFAGEARCATCGQAIEHDAEGSWIDRTGGDGCGDGVHTPDVAPAPEGGQ